MLYVYIGISFFEVKSKIKSWICFFSQGDASHEPQSLDSGSILSRQCQVAKHFFIFASGSSHLQDNLLIFGLDFRPLNQILLFFEFYVIHSIGL